MTNKNPKEKTPPHMGAMIFKMEDKFTVTGEQLYYILKSVDKMAQGGRQECPPFSYLNLNRITDTVFWMARFREGPPNY